MDKKENRTFDRYKRIAAEMILFHNLGLDLVVTIQHVIPAAKIDKLQGAINNIDDVRSRTEDNMFKDIPNLNDDYLYVFYGFLSSTSTNHVKEEQVDLAKKILADIFELEDENVLVSDKSAVEK